MSPPNIFKNSYDISRIFELKATGCQSNTRIIFGCNSIDRLSMEVEKYSIDNVLLITSKYHGSSGLVDRIKSILNDIGLQVFIYTEVGPDAIIKTAEHIYSMNANKNISLLIGLGGGSVMDTSKLLVLCLNNKLKPSPAALSEPFPYTRKIKFFLIPTTSGSGSEVTPYFVISNGKDKLLGNNPACYPDIAFIDPTLTVSMPPKLTAITGMDALSHAIEGMMNINSNPLSDILCNGAVELCGAYIRRSVKNAEDLEARTYLSLASTVAQLGMVMSGATYAHSVAYVLAKYKPTPHGLGCAIGLPYVMAYNAKSFSTKLAVIAKSLGGAVSQLSELKAAQLAAIMVRDLAQEISLPITLEEYGGIAEKDLEEASRLMIEQYPRPMNPRSMNLEESLKFWYGMYHGILF
jgi:alcohol dehydrogenase